MDMYAALKDLQARMERVETICDRVEKFLDDDLSLDPFSPVHVDLCVPFVAEYKELLAGGLSDYEARGTVWPDVPDDLPDHPDSEEN